MSWNLGPFLLKILPRYKIPFTIGSASFKWLHIIVRLGYQVKIWSKSCRKSPKDLCKRLRITLKSANQKNWRLPSKKHLFCAFLTNCLVLDYHLYCLIFPWPFCLAKTYINDKNTFFFMFPNYKNLKNNLFSWSFIWKPPPGHHEKKFSAQTMHSIWANYSIKCAPVPSERLML